MSGQVHRGTRIAAALLVVLLTTGMAAAASRREQGPGVIYAAFSVLKSGKAGSKRCAGYTVYEGAYTGMSASPDPRLAGRATLDVRIALDPRTGLGITRGTLKIRDRARRTRLSAVVQGVNSNSSTVNGIVSGNLVGPNALLLANVTMVFNENFTFGVVRLGLEDGRNSAVAYSALPARCS
jgi:hypothetical protein